MTQFLPKLVSHQEFMDWYPNDGKRYELHKGVIVEMPPPTGEHENVVGFLTVQKFIGDPKQPTFSVCQLVGDEYQVTKFMSNDLIISPTLPNLKLTAQQVFDVAL